MLVSDSDVWFESSLYRLAIDKARPLDRYNAWSWCTCLQSMLVEFMLLGIAASSAAARAPKSKTRCGTYNSGHSKLVLQHQLSHDRGVTRLDPFFLG